MMIAVFMIHGMQPGPLLLSLGDPLILVSRPISVILLTGAAFSIMYPLLKKPKILQG